MKILQKLHDTNFQRFWRKKTLDSYSFNQYGLTLVELMVGLVVSLLITLIIQSLYTQTKKISKVSDSLSRLQENGRYGIEMLESDIRMAGFLGCRGQPGAPLNMLNGTDYQYRYSQGIYGFAATGISWSPALDTSLSSLSPAPLPSSDIVTVWGADQSGLALLQPMTLTTDAPQVGANTLFQTGDIALITDCDNRALFQITEPNPQTAGNLSHAVSASFSPGNSTTNFQHVFDADASVYRVTARTYYVAPSVLKPGTNSLWRYCVPVCYGSSQSDEISQGVDGLYFLYGVDTDLDDAANKYLPANTVTTGNNWSNVVSIKLQILLASTQNGVTASQQVYSYRGENITSTDNRLRTVMDNVITLRNRAP